MQFAKYLTPPGQRATDVLNKAWAWLFLLTLVVFFSIFGRGFFDIFNFQRIGANMAIMLIMALGQTFVIIAGGIDLSTGFAMSLASVVAALTITSLDQRTPLPLLVLAAIAAGIGSGLVVGFINGFIIARLRVPPFIVTLGMLGIAEGVGFLVSGGLPISVQTPGIGEIGNGNLAYYIPSYGLSFFHLPTPLPAGVRARDVIDILPYPLLILIVLVIVCYWVLRHTRFGQHAYAIGGNRLAARRAGIPVIRQTILIYMVSSMMAALAGLLYVFSFTNGAANAGDASLLPSIAAVVIGGASLFGGEGGMIGTLVGALITSVIQNGLVIIGVNGYWQFVAVGIVIILAVLVDQAKARVEE